MGSGSSALQRSIDHFAGSIVANGVRDIVISPGSRNAPLMIAFQRIPGLRIHTVVDERSAAFTAMGMAQALKAPVALCCTSGSAAVNYYPAITESFYSRIPLLVLTADRPSELIDRWDGQCIRQNGLFSSHVCAEFVTPEDYTNEEIFSTIAEMAVRSLQKPTPGPVHVNIPLREPLYSDITGPVDLPEKVIEQSYNIPESDMSELIREIADSNRILVLRGARESFQNRGLNLDIHSDAIVELADVVSGKRSGAGLEAWDGMLHTTETNADLSPDLLITLGTATLSKGLKKLLRNNPPKKHFHIYKVGEVADPFFTSPIALQVSDISEIETALRAKKNTEFADNWRNTIQHWRNSFDELDWMEFNEFSAMRFLLRSLPESYNVHLSNSMPVRYASFLHAHDRLNLFCNRGTSGIDGCTSTAVGFAKGSGDPTCLITGDLAFFYDVNGLWQDLPENLRIIVLNNHGGGIFGLIDGPGKNPQIADLQQTPNSRTAKNISREFGLSYFRASDHGSLVEQFESWQSTKGPALLEIETNKEDNKAFYSKFTSIEI